MEFLIGTGRTVTESNNGEVTHVPWRQSTDAQRLGQRHHRCVDEAQPEVDKAPVDFHGAGEMPECRRCICEGATREILHEQLHPLALVAKEVVNFGQHETGDVAGPCLVNGLAKQPVVRCALDQIPRVVSRCHG
jgi:hypothetical protein